MGRHDSIPYTLADLGNIIQGCAGFTEELSKSIVKKYKDPRGTSILEAGCGSGKLGMFFEKFGMDCVGIDIDREQIEYANKLKSILNILLETDVGINFYEGTVHRLEFPDNHFNFCFSEGVIEHWTGNKRQNVVNEMARVVSDAVMIFVPWSGHAESRKIARECEHIFVGMGKREYPLSEEQLRKNLEDAGLCDIDVHSCRQDIPIARRMLFGVGYK